METATPSINHCAGITDGLLPPPDYSVSTWADKNRILAGKAASEPGRWRTDRTPYLREIMDCLSNESPVKRLIFAKGAQLGGTEVGNNWLGYIIHHVPAPILYVQPTVDVANKVSKQRVAPMIASTKVLAERVAAPRSRDSGNTLLVKEFPGGLLIMAGANSAAGLRSMPIKNLFLDEVDRYQTDVDGEGDPIALAEKRTSTFARSKIFMCSTPTIKGLSRIEAEYLKTDQRRYFVPCPHCKNFDWIRWANIQWTEGDPSTAQLFCEKCKQLIPEHHKTWMLEQGQWRPTAPENVRVEIAGFHLSSLYSPLGWKSWSEITSEFIDVKHDPSRLKVWVNTELGETWEEEGTGIEPDILRDRRAKYPAEVPAGVGLLVAAVDVQDDRLEVQVKGFGAGEESWLIAYEQLHGDPGQQKVWDDLDNFLRQKFDHESGAILSLAATAIDSGGHHTEAVYRFCKARVKRRVWAIKGSSADGREIVARPSQRNRYRVKLFPVGVNTAKDIIFSRLRIKSPGPGFMHLPEWVDEEYLLQLTAEKRIRKYVRGRGSVRQYIKIRERNEALDLEVYSLAALHTLPRSTIKQLGALAAAHKPAKGQEGAKKDGDDTGDSGASGTPSRPKKVKKGWVDGWKH